MKKILDWLDAHTWPLILLALVFATALFMAGCSTTRTKSVEHWKGAIGGAPVNLDRAVETEAVTDYDLPPIGGIIQEAVEASPWGWAATAGMGLVSAFLGKKALQNGRQRDELADGIESGKDDMDPVTWEKVKKRLIDNQSDDTAKAVKARVG